MSRSNFTRLQLQTRYQLLRQVKQEVKQYRLHSLHRAVLTTLANETPPLRMRRTWDIEAKVGNRPSFRIPADSGILPVFDRIGGKLLILGAVGSGKTTTLNGLAKVFVKRAMEDENEPIPVLFNLATWTDHEQSIPDWIIEQLKLQYNISSDVSQDWLNQLQILPLLDGLDEVPDHQSNLCIQKINEFLQSDISPLHLVVCSSVEAYHYCQTKLQLNGAILLRPLTKKQIRKYLMNARSRELWNYIESDQNLLKLAKKPLFLSMMTLAYEEILIESWKRLTTLEQQQSYLFNAYIRSQIASHRMRQSLPKNSSLNLDKIRQWLEWLAKRLEEEDKSEFSVNDIPQTWLQDLEQETTYQISVRVVKGVIWWGVIGLILIGAITASMGIILVGMILGIIWGIISELFAINDWIEQFILRGILSSQGYLPWNARQFLNTVTQQLLLQRVGDRYQFIHRWLQQHFAQM